MKTIVVQKWMESERGWGIRPDGYSIHNTLADCHAYISRCMANQPEEIPDEYSYAAGAPFPLDVPDDVNAHDVRIWHTEIIRGEATPLIRALRERSAP